MKEKMNIGPRPLEVERPAAGGGARIHDKGAKGERDRAIVLHSYHAMCDEFKVPKGERLSPKDIATMTTTQLYQAAKDLYNNSTIKDAKRLARKLNVGAPLRKSITLQDRVAAFLLAVPAAFSQARRALRLGRLRLSARVSLRLMKLGRKVNG